jgi:Helix-turn-helix domain
MTPRFAKVSEIAERYRVSVDAVYLWIRQGKIPADCVVRIAGTVRVDEEQFEARLRSGSLYQSRGRKPTRGDSVAGKVATGVIAEDNFTTVREGPRTSHRTGEGGSVGPEHPFSPEMVRSER